MGEWQTRQAARRLLKSRLRFCVLSKLVERDSGWTPAAEVERAIQDQAYEDWVKARSSWVSGDLEPIVADALEEAAVDVSESFRELVPGFGVDPHIDEFVEAFDPKTLTCSDDLT